MPTSWDECNVQCPFYRQNDGRNIRCEGIWPGSGITVTYSGPKVRLAHMERFCMSRYTRCQLYRQIQQKYEE